MKLVKSTNGDNNESFWDSTERWWRNTCESVEDWWEEDGQEMTDNLTELAMDDAEGALLGSGAAAITGAGIAPAAVTGGIMFSGKTAIEQFPEF